MPSDQDDMEPTRDAISEVLTNVSLFRLVTAFVPGLPYFAGEFECRERWRVSPSGWYPAQRGRLAHLAVLADDVEILAQLYAVSCNPHFKGLPELEFFDVVRCAVRSDRINVLEWVSTHIDLNTYDFESDLLEVAILYSDSTAVLQWLHDHLPEFPQAIDSQMIYQAVRTSRLDVLRWLQAHNYEDSLADFMTLAASIDELEMVRFFHELQPEGSAPVAMNHAAKNGHLEVVKFLHYNRTEGCSEHAMTDAALAGHHDVVAFLGANRSEGVLPDTMSRVVSAGDAEMVRLLCEFSNAGCLFDERRRAASRHDAVIVAILQEFMDENIKSCAIKRHSKDATGWKVCMRTPRPCQRPETRSNNAGTTTTSTAEHIRRKYTGIEPGDVGLLECQWLWGVVEMALDEPE